jgi:hypothetical protein
MKDSMVTVSMVINNIKFEVSIDEAERLHKELDKMFGNTDPTRMDITTTYPIDKWFTCEGKRLTYEDGGLIIT